MTGFSSSTISKYLVHVKQLVVIANISTQSSAHTNSIKGHQGVLKCTTPKQKRTDDQAEDCIHEKVWRQHN